MSRNGFTGVIPPVCTPSTPAGDLDRGSLTRLCEFLLDAGVDGLFVGGSTGEVALLDDEQRLAALTVAVDVAAGAVPVLFGAIDTSTARSIVRARAAQQRGAAAIVATAPFYVAPHPDEISTHFRLIHDRVDLPLIAYDIPSAVHVALPPSTVVELARDGIIAGLKDSSGDLAGFRTVLAGTRGLPFTCLSGSEVLADLAIACGGHGLVPGLGNVDPHGYVRLFRAAAAGDLATAQAEQERLTRLFGIIEVGDRGRIGHTAAALGSFKAALALRGVIDHDPTFPPLGALTDDERQAVGKILAAVDLGTVG
ncbi:MAG TPA: dihydrodipicolinate synthase family protein [Pseudonocardiaceae bacterium]|jgi:4-hydroxy-tetrahydrodipicolinate synthase|nr:dihydrodipicolinate synthase family protein [Pseudonocardiaceae bacterium]